jgi:uncharacterized protein YcfJ
MKPSPVCPRFDETISPLKGYIMRNLMLALGAAAMAVPAAVTLPSSQAEAAPMKKRNYQYREWRGKDGRRYCRRSDGTTGLVIGAVAGGLLGTAVDTGAGTVIGAVGGALAGRAIDRSESRKRCR